MSCSDNKRSYTTYQNYLATKNQTGCCCYLVGPTGPTGPSTSSTAGTLASQASIPGTEGDLLFKSGGDLSSAVAPYNLNWSASNVFDISASNVFIHSGITTSTIKVTETAGHGGKIQLMELSSPSKHYVALKAPDAISNDITFTLPLKYPGADGAILVGDRTGELRWVSSPLGSSSPLPSGYLSPVIELSTLQGDASYAVMTPAKDTYVARFLPPRSAMYNKITIGLIATSFPPSGSVQACVYVADNMNKDHTYTCIAQSTDIGIPSAANFSTEQTVFLPIIFNTPFSLTDTSGHLVALKWKPADSLSPLHVAGQSYNPTHTGTSGWLYDSTGSSIPLSIDISTLNNSIFTMWIRIS